MTICDKDTLDGHTDGEGNELCGLNVILRCTMSFPTVDIPVLSFATADDDPATASAL